MKAYTPAVLDAVAAALTHAYWFRDDLKSFLTRAGVPGAMVATLPWDQRKRDVARNLVDRLAKSPATGTPIIEKLIDSLVEQSEDFPHLASLEDGARKVADAQKAMRHLKDVLGQKGLVERAERARREKRTEAERATENVRRRQASLVDLQHRFLALFGMQDHQRRGLDFQPLLRDLFALYDLDPRSSFARPGEQTDGSIRLDGLVLLVEARWTEALTAPSEVRDFRSKVQDKLDSTLGLMISMAGFTDEAVASASQGGRFHVLLMDGADLAPVFRGLHDLVDVLRRKHRHASEEGRAMYRIGT